jgi:hypothetical protein
MNGIRAYLGVLNHPNEHYPKVHGSCEWISARQDFQDWKNGIAYSTPEHEAEAQTKGISIFWIHANPGSGKTVLASHVVTLLQDSQLESAYFHFHFGNKSSSSLSAFLRAIASQMASHNSSIREKLHEIHQEGLGFNLDDSQMIWSLFFKKGIFEVSSLTNRCMYHLTLT